MKPTLDEVLAKRLREVAEEKGIPISHVADRAGMSHSYFWKLLAAKASTSLKSVERLAGALGVDPLELLTEKAGATTKKTPRSRVKRAAKKTSG